MDTKWKEFRYGTEERNPFWSFFGSVLCLDFALTAFALAYQRGSGIWTMTGLWFLLFSVISLANLGRDMKNEKENLIHVRQLDKTCPDLMLFLLLSVLFFVLFVSDWNGNNGWWSYSHTVNRIFRYFGWSASFLWEFVLMFFMVGAIIMFAVVLYMSVMRQIFREKFRKKLFFFRLKERWKKYRMFHAQKGDAARHFRIRPLLLLCGQGLLFLLTCLYLAAVYYDLEDVMLIIIPMGSAFFLLDLFVLLKISREAGILLDEIHHIAEDREIWEEPVLKPYSLFRKTEEALLSIRENKRESMEKRLQSERMKVELITNVSHDLKTPLTSMIGCIDLLKQVENMPEEAQDYVKLLSFKAQRLRGMIQDVFDMAKAASGQELQMEQLDMGRLIRQTVADMQDRIEESGLHYRMKIENRKLAFLGDSKKMYRVYQNLIENTLKYSMEGSRVYVEVSECDGKIRTSIKNTSGCEMNFSAEEIVERFARGDRNRSTEGNGLGLAIARSFTEACGGTFQVTLDGDLFRVDTVFQKEHHKD